MKEKSNNTSYQIAHLNFVKGLPVSVKLVIRLFDPRILPSGRFGGLFVGATNLEQFK